MFRDLSLPKTLPRMNSGLYMQAEDLPGSKEDLNACRPTTLRHSWYKAVPHHFDSVDTVHLKLHELRMKELKLLLEQKVDHALMINEYLLPL